LLKSQNRVSTLIFKLKTMNKLKSILFSLLTIATFTVFLTSCEKDLMQQQTKTTLNTQQGYVFDGLKLNQNSVKSIDNGSLVFDKYEEAFGYVLNKKPENLYINIPLSSNEVLELKLEKWNIFSDNFTLEDEEGNASKSEVNGIFYHGILNGEENSIVSASIFENDLSIMVISSKDTYHLNKGKDGLLTLDKVSSGAFEFNSKLCELSCGDNIHSAFQLNETGLPDFAISKTAKSGGCTYDPIRVCYVIDQSFINYFGSYSNAKNYFASKFNSAKAMYSYWGIPIQFGGYFRRTLNINTNHNGNILDPPFIDLLSKFGKGSNGWDVLGSVVAIRKNGVLTGNGLGNVGLDCGSAAPICKKGYNNGAQPGCMPFSIVALRETSSGATNDHYMIYTLAHELGHNFRILDSNANDVMDHGAGNQHHIAYNTYLDMYAAWVDCYYNCN